MLGLSLQKITQQIKRHWKISCLVLFFLPVLLRLGFWQLERAEEKQQLLTVYQQQRELPAILLNELPEEKRQAYRNVKVTGYYDTKHYWLLDNQPRSGKVGYEVVMPLAIREAIGERIVLINRGWVEAARTRDQLPEIDTPIEEVVINGYLYPMQTNAVIKHSESDLTVDWPKRVLQLDNQVASAALQKKVDPLLLRLNEDSPGALLTDWPIINTQPEKHQGYAVQWFAMALALICLYVWLLFRDHSTV